MTDMRPLYKKKTCVVLCSMTCLLLLALVAGKEKLFSENIPYYWAAGMIVFLFFYGIQAVVMVYKKIETAKPRQMVFLYVILKGLKIFLFLAALTVYMLVVRIEIKRFVLTATALYMIYLLFDTFFLASVENNLKRNGN